MAAALVVAAITLAACTTGPRVGELSIEQADSLRRSLAIAGGATSPSSGASPGSTSPQRTSRDAAPSDGSAASATATRAGAASSAKGARPGDASTPRTQPRLEGEKPPDLPTSRAELERRARAAMGPGRTDAELTFVGDAPRYAFALQRLARGEDERLLLIDLSVDPGLVVGEHDFGPSDPSPLAVGAPSTPDAKPEEPTEASAPSRMIGALEVTSDSGEPVLLAEIGGATSSAACGWWLRRRGTTFVCAPRAVPTSSYRSMGRVLVETWQIAIPGAEAETGVSGASGRLYRIFGGRWRQEDEFHCMARPLEAALREAGPPGLAAWQTAAVRQRVIGARRASEALETDQAIALLRDALAIDACEATSWRLLGRLEFERGRAATASPELAVALALSGGEPATMVDLADAVAVLNAAPGAGTASLEATIEALESHGSTRAVLDRARQETGGRVTPRTLAIALYESFLAQTSAGDLRVEAARRRAGEQVSALRGSGHAATASGVRPSSAKAAPKAKPKPAANAKPKGSTSGNTKAKPGTSTAAK